MNRAQYWLMAVTLALVATVGLSQAPDSEPESAPVPPEPRAAEGESAPPSEDAPVSDDVFIPSEELQADEEVTFPVDI